MSQYGAWRFSYNFSVVLSHCSHAPRNSVAGSRGGGFFPQEVQGLFPLQQGVLVPMARRGGLWRKCFCRFPAWPAGISLLAGRIIGNEFLLKVGAFVLIWRKSCLYKKARLAE